MTGIKFLSKLSAGTRRNLYAGGIILVIVGVISISMPDGNLRKTNEKKTIVHLLTDQDTSKVTMQGLAAKIDALRTTGSKMQREIDQIRSDQKEIAKDKGPTRLMQKEIADLRSKLQTADRKNSAVMARLDQVEENGLEVSQEMIEEYMNSKGKVNYSNTGGSGYNDGGLPAISAMQEANDEGVGQAQRLTAADLPGSSRNAPVNNNKNQEGEAAIELYASAEEFFKKAPSPMGTGSSRKSSGSSSAAASTSAKMKIRSIASGDGQNGTVSARAKQIEKNREREKEEDEPEEAGTYIPAGSMIEAVVITGMDAPTSQTAKRDPFPALMRFKKEALLPNRYTADIRECFLIASGYGSMSSERAFLRGET